MTTPADDTIISKLELAYKITANYLFAHPEAVKPEHRSKYVEEQPTEDEPEEGPRPFRSYYTLPVLELDVEEFDVD